MIYATYVDREIVFQNYDSFEELKDYLDEKNLLELHLFDQEREMRFLKRRGGKLSCYLIPNGVEYDDCYLESIFCLGENIDQMEKLSQKVEVVNYIRYDENDLLHIVNYRLKEIG